MRRSVIATLLVLSMTAPAARVAAATPADAAGSVSGTAQPSAGHSAANAAVRLRNLTTGNVAGTSVTDASGAFTFAGVEPGNYVVEMLDGAGNVVSTSATVAVTQGAVTGVAVGSAAAVAGGVGGFFGSTLGILTIAAAGAGVAGVTVAANRPVASPSR